MTDPTNPYSELARLWARTMTGFLPGWTSDANEEAEGSPDPAELMERMTEAHLTTMASGFRYMQRWIELSSRAYPLALRAVSRTSSDGDEEPGAVLDELRETLRMMAELPLEEFRRLQAELGDLWKMEPTDDEAEQGDPPRRRRRARVKE